MNVRPAIESDAPAIAGLCTQLGYPSTPEEVARRLRQILSWQGQALFVAEVGGQVAGWIHVQVYPLPEMDLHTEIGGLIVDEAQRGRGVGRMLLARAEEWAQAQGCAEIRVRCNIIRARTHKFYEQCGYANIKTQHTFRKKLQ